MSNESTTKSLLPVDFLAVGYFIVSFLYTSTANTPTLDLTIDDPIEDHHIQLLLRELSKIPVGGLPTSADAFSERVVLRLRKPSITGLKSIASYLKKIPLISKLDMQDVDFHGFIQEFAAGMLHTRKSILTKLVLNIDYVPAGRSTLLITYATIECAYLNKPLTELDLSSIRQLSEKELSSIVDQLQHNTTLLKLNLSTGIALNPDTAKALTKMLEVNKSLTHLRLNCSVSWDSEGLNVRNTDIVFTHKDPYLRQALHGMLQRENKPKHFNLSQTDTVKFSDIMACSVFKGLQHNNTLVNLNLSNTGISATESDTARALVTMLTVNKSLTHLNLSQLKNFSDTGACCVFKGLQHNNTLVNLNLSNTGIAATEPDTAQALVTMLQVNKSLTHLNLSQLDKFSDTGACSVFEGLKHNGTIVNLNLSKTAIAATEPDTAKALVKMLQVNKSLTHLTLAHLKNFSDLGAFCVFKGLRHNASLVNLNLTNCNIAVTDPDTVRSLTNMLEENNSLTHFNFSGNKSLSDLGAQCIFEGLQHNRTLVHLNLSGTNITATNPDTAKTLTEMLQVNKSLTHFDLSCKGTVPNNRILSILFSSLEHNTTLHHLVLRGRDVSKDDAECIVQSLKSNRSLLTIDMQYAYISRADIIFSILKFNISLKKLCINYINRATEVALEDLKKARKESGLPPIDIVFLTCI